MEKKLRENSSGGETSR